MAHADPKPPRDPAGSDKERRASFRGGLVLATLLGLLFLAAGVFGYLVLFTDAFRDRNREVNRTGEPLSTPKQLAGGNREEKFEVASTEPVLAPGTPTPVESLSPSPTVQKSPDLTPLATPPAPIPVGSVSPEPTPALAIAMEPGTVPNPGDRPASGNSQSPLQGTSAVPRGTGSEDTSVLLKKDPEEERRVRQEVLVRVDLLKELTQAEKDHLYSQVERARGFTKLAIVPFLSGRVMPEDNQVEHLMSYLRQPSFQKLFEDPTVVLVCVGYADRKGSEAQNMEISHRRAENVVRILQSQTRIRNLMRAVGMGGSDLFDKTDAAKNRVVEIWLVQP